MSPTYLFEGEEHAHLREAARRLWPAFFGGLLVVVPWLARNWLEFDSPFPGQAVDGGAGGQRIPVAAEMIGAQRVHRHDDHIRFPLEPLADTLLSTEPSAGTRVKIDAGPEGLTFSTQTQ